MNEQGGSLIQGLATICREKVFPEKWLLVPSLRVGYQWLDRITFSGQALLNVRLKTLRHLALELAAPEMDRLGLTFVTSPCSHLLIGRLFNECASKEGGYLFRLEPGLGLIRKLHGSIQDLRLAGIDSGKLADADFEVRTKGREIRRLLEAYEKHLSSERFADYADLLRMAERRISLDPKALPPDVTVVLPQGMEKCWLETKLIEAMPSDRRVELAVEHPLADAPSEARDLEILRWLPDPGRAPAAKVDGTARIFRAVGEANEVREVFRRCLEEKIPFDQVEVLHTGAKTYIPLIFELGWRLKENGENDLPITFAEGIPSRYARPGRALASYLSWIREGYPQGILVRMIQDGLIEPGSAEDRNTVSFDRMGALLRSVPIGAGRDRYLQALDREIDALQAHIEREPEAEGKANLTRRCTSMTALRDITAKLLEIAPGNEAPPGALLDWAEQFLSSHVRCVTQFDEYSRRGLLRAVRDFNDGLEAAGGRVVGLDPWTWLESLPEEVRVGGIGPRPGCLFVSNIASGGHSGRKHTFVLGLDDTRFPGSGQQDPLLLDGERGHIASRLRIDLPMASKRLEGRAVTFERLLARIQGNLTLAYSCRNLLDDRETFPSLVLMNAFRVLSNLRSGDQKDFLQWLAAQASFAPSSEGRCIDLDDWWLWRLLGKGDRLNPDPILSGTFAHLARGLRAEAERRSDRFTEYDGHVPEAGRDLDPYAPAGPVLSASRLELLGRCPLEYFFKYILEIEPPVEYEIDPAAWLDPPARGALLHGVFRSFVEAILETGQRPSYREHLELMKRILDEETRRFLAIYPPPNREVFDREYDELDRTAQIFLMEEEAFWKENRPLCLEASIGMPPEGGGTLLDTKAPIEIALAKGRSIRVQGRIDRVDQLQGKDGRSFAVLDYKTGGMYGFDPGDPFKGGRRVQGALYMDMVQSRLRAVVDPRAQVVSFGYFFPSVRAHGERLAWTRDRMTGGLRVIEKLCALLARGAFPFTSCADDVKHSSYKSAFGDHPEEASSVRRKTANETNDALLPFRELRSNDGES